MFVYTAVSKEIVPKLVLYKILDTKSQHRSSEKLENCNHKSRRKCQNKVTINRVAKSVGQNLVYFFRSRLFNEVLDGIKNAATKLKNSFKMDGIARHMMCRYINCKKVLVQ